MDNKLTARGHTLQAAALSAEHCRLIRSQLHSSRPDNNNNNTALGTSAFTAYPGYTPTDPPHSHPPPATQVHLNQLFRHVPTEFIGSNTEAHTRSAFVNECAWLDAILPPSIGASIPKQLPSKRRHPERNGAKGSVRFVSDSSESFCRALPTLENSALEGGNSVSQTVRRGRAGILSDSTNHSQ